MTNIAGPYTEFRIPCKVKNLMQSSYGKYSDSETQSIQVFEYSQFLPLVSQYLPPSLKANEDFKLYLKT